MVSLKNSLSAKKAINAFIEELGLNPLDIFKKQRSIIFKNDANYLQKLFNEKSTFSEILIEFGYKHIGNNYTTLRRAIKDSNIDLTKFKENNKKYNRTKHIDKSMPLLPYAELISKTSSRNTIKKNIIRNDLIPYYCSECGNNGMHNGKQLTLQLDHIDGNGMNNDLSNLRFLCPNCHTQTPTFGSRNSKYEITPLLRCAECDTVLFRRNKHNMCVECYRKTEIHSETLKKSCKPRPRVFEVSKEELQKLVKEIPMTTIGKMFGVRDNAIRKRCILLGIELKPMKGYWAKLAAGKIQAE